MLAHVPHTQLFSECLTVKFITYRLDTIASTDLKQFLKWHKATKCLKTISFFIHVTVHCVKFLIIEPTRWINFSNLFLGWKSTCFGQFLCPLSEVFYCTHSNAVCRILLLTAYKQDQDGTAFYPDPARKLSTNLYGIHHWCVYSEKLLMMDRETVRNM
jgi:hypothetical protein